MNTTEPCDPFSPLVLRTRGVFKMGGNQFFQLYGIDKELRIERNASGDIEIMTPVDWLTSLRDVRLTIARIHLGTGKNLACGWTLEAVVVKGEGFISPRSRLWPRARSGR